MIKLTVVTPEKKLVFEQEATDVLVPAHRGQLNLMNLHSPLVTTLETGVLKWKLVGQEVYSKAAISWGYCTVSASSVYILADIARLPEEIDQSVQTEEIQKQSKKLGSESLSDFEWEQTQRELAFAKASLEIQPKI